ncbi:secreted oxidoreductase [Streptomyces sp. OM5714]|nr:secreted oxidoreductase [Streptomyces sp. OM5714]
MQVTYHNYGYKYTNCYANAGAAADFGMGTNWVTRISTGNNRVQWYGDGRWQPATPIAKNTVYQWPNHPGGVRIDAIRIL